MLGACFIFLRRGVGFCWLSWCFQCLEPGTCCPRVINTRSFDWLFWPDNEVHLVCLASVSTRNTVGVISQLAIKQASCSHFGRVAWYTKGQEGALRLCGLLLLHSRVYSSSAIYPNR